MFKRILIGNRGEVGERIIRACRKMEIEPVPVYSEADSNLPYLKDIDTKVCIGPGKSSESYLNREAILQAAINTESQALHPGFGFLAEDELFSYMCSQQKITFIGPSAGSIALMGNKSKAKDTFKSAGLKVIPGSEGNLASLEEAEKIAKGLGFPVLLKASAGGGGRGIRICNNFKDLKSNYFQAQIEAEKNFGSSELYLEKLIDEAKHIEFQLMGDIFGNIVHFGERECSIQRNNQKLIEEAPSPSLSPEKRAEAGINIIKALKKIGYKNAGTIEFLMDSRKNLYFMEMNTRLQVEHPVTEMITGIDIVKKQIEVAMNKTLDLTQKEIRFSGHSIECRINAEDPFNDFKPSPGIITKFEPAYDRGPGKIRVDTHVKEGYEIPIYYDSMIAKVISFGNDRNEAIETMKRSLEKFIIKGIKTTIPLHLEILGSKEFISGNYNNKTLEKIMKVDNG
ncbi:MAG: acetyl-CoA carboxylase biotin carboxylase subunit [Acidobacteriota bacterium]